MTTRRSFLAAGAVLAASSGSAQDGAAETLPKMKFFQAEISRLVLGVNPFYGFAHYNNNYGNVMREWYTPERVCDVLHRAERAGINAYNYVNIGRSPQDLARYRAAGGRMQLIMQVAAGDDAVALARDLKPLAMHRQGEVVDKAWQAGDMKSIREWCKQVRDLGVLVGVGTHKPEVIAKVEEENWDVDFYAGCVYNRTRTPDEWKQVLHGEIPEMPGEVYIQSDPARMYRVMRQTKKPCFAFKVLAAGRIADRSVEQAFRTAFESIKPTDGVFVGMFPRFKDEVRENTAIVRRVLAKA